MIGDRSQLVNFVQKFFGTVKFGNDHLAKIMGYGDYQIRNVTISQVYYMEGLGHNLFSVGQFCDIDLEVAFRQHTCFILNLDGVDLLTGSRGNNLYTLSLQDMMASSPICLLSKASKTKSWLWHRRLSLRRIQTDNGTEFVNQTLRDYYEEVGISHETSVARSPQQNGVIERQAVATACFTQSRSIIRLRHGKTSYELMHGKQPDLSFFHVFGALCYPTNDSENIGKLQPKADIGIFIGYASTKKAFRIYNRCTRPIVETIHVDFDELTSMASEQSSSGPALNDMIPGTMSLGLTPYELMHGKQHDLSFFHVFCALCYPTNASENIGKLQPKADIGIFIGYAPTKKAFHIYNRRTRRIVKTIHVDFDELTAMASEQSSSGPVLQEMIPGTISSGPVQKSSSSTSYVPP
nr:hypothetical protein [Tanacetum cinerariifolium]